MLSRRVKPRPLEDMVCMESFRISPADGSWRDPAKLLRTSMAGSQSQPSEAFGSTVIECRKNAIPWQSVDSGLQGERSVKDFCFPGTTAVVFLRSPWDDA